jgi:hypothetical protein
MTKISKYNTHIPLPNDWYLCYIYLGGKKMNSYSQSHQD